MRRTKMIYTLGPATDRPGVLAALIRAGMDCARFNFSHGKQKDHERRFHALRAEAKRQGRVVAALMDLAGPKLRVGAMADGQLRLVRGGTVRVTPRNVRGVPGLIPVTYPHLAKDLERGAEILLDDGQMVLQVMRAEGPDLICRVRVGGTLLDRKGLNLPGVVLSVPALTPQDERDLAFGLELGMDHVALSFVRRPEEMEDLRRRIRRAGSSAGLIAKIEKPQALDHLEAIITASDGVMVARGDLGVELSPETVPPLQKRIIAEANRANRLVITATQMLQSMMDSPVPTRAEASDVANAIFDGSDAVMLSGETAAGSYPVQAAQTMARIILQAEASPEYNRLRGSAPLLGPDDALVASAVELANGLRARALVVFTQSGATARLAARRRPVVPLVAFAHDDRVARRLALAWGVRPLVIRVQKETEALLASVERTLLARELARPGETVVVLASSPVAKRSHVNFLKVQTLGRSRSA